MLNWINATPSISEGQQKMSPCPSTHHLYFMGTNTPNWLSELMHKTHKNWSRSVKLQPIKQPPPNVPPRRNNGLIRPYFWGRYVSLGGCLISHKPRVSKKMKTTMMNTERNANTPISSWSPTFSPKNIVGVDFFVDVGGGWWAFLGSPKT